MKKADDEDAPAMKSMKSMKASGRKPMVLSSWGPFLTGLVAMDISLKSGFIIS